MPFFLATTLAVTASLLIRAELAGNRRQVYFFKPLSTLLVIAVAVPGIWAPGYSTGYTTGVLIGLLFSLGGDIALMFKEQRQYFLTGLVLFLLGHIAYGITFHLPGRMTPWDIPVALLLLVACTAFYRLIAPGLGNMRLPVILYMLVISIMVSRSVALLANPEFGASRASIVIAGALLFYFSDIMLAADRFWRPWPLNRLSLAFYYSGQYLIALSAVVPGN